MAPSSSLYLGKFMVPFRPCQELDMASTCPRSVSSDPCPYLFISNYAVAYGGPFCRGA